MRYFPINLDICGKTAVVIGGGAVAGQKCPMLIKAGALVTVIAPQLEVSLQQLRDVGSLRHLPRDYRYGDLAGALLAFAATDQPEINRAVAAEAGQRGILLNVADAPAASSFTSPAIVSRGELLITVSTGGKSPALARQIREELAGRFGEEYEMALELLGAVREKLLTLQGDSAYNKKLLNELVRHNLPELYKNNSVAALNHLLLELFGLGFSLDELGVGEKERT